MTLQLARSVDFQCAHSYEVKAWTKDENLKEFGPCFSPTGHGHSYRLECFVEGPVDPTTGMIINLRDLDQILKEVTSEIDGKFLNKEVREFLNTNPTTERIAEHLFKKIEEKLKPFHVELKRVRLFETDQLWVDVVQ